MLSNNGGCGRVCREGGVCVCMVRAGVGLNRVRAMHEAPKLRVLEWIARRSCHDTRATRRAGWSSTWDAGQDLEHDKELRETLKFLQVGRRDDTSEEQASTSWCRAGSTFRSRGGTRSGSQLSLIGLFPTRDR